MSSLDDELVGINDDAARLKRDQVSVKQEVKDGLRSLDMRFGRWFAELFMLSGRALMHPFPFQSRIR